MYSLIAVILLSAVSCTLLVFNPVDPSSPAGFLSFAALAPATSQAGQVSAASDDDSGTGQSPELYTVGGTVYGLTGTGLTLTMTGSVPQNLSVAAGSSSYTFATGLETGHNFTLSVSNQPGGQAGCTFADASGGTVSSSNITSMHLYCTPPPAPHGTGPALFQNVDVDGQGNAATVTAGALFSISLDYAIQGGGCGTCIRPAFVGIGGPAPQADQMACVEDHNPPSTYHTWVSPDPVFYKPFNANLRAPATSGVYLIRGRSGLTFCSLLEGNFTTQGTILAVIAVP